MAQKPDLAAFRARIWGGYNGIEDLLREMLRIRTFLRGSVYELKTRCGKPSCVCSTGKPHRRWVLTESIAGKKHLRVLPRDQEELWCRRAEDYRLFRRRRAEFVKAVRRILQDLDAVERAQRRSLED